MLFINNERKKNCKSLIVIAYQKSTKKSKKNTPNIDSCCVNSDRIKHHPGLPIRSNNKNCAANISKIYI